MNSEMKYNRYFRVIIENILFEIYNIEHTTFKLNNKWVKIADGVLLVYNTEYRFSFDRLKEYNETIHFIKESFVFPMVLVACVPQNALRKVSRKEGYQAAKQFGVPYKEFGIENGKEVCKVFQRMVKEIRIFKGEEQKKCKVM